MNNSLPASFSPGQTAIGNRGQRAHPELIAQSSRLAPELYTISDNAWCYVGNGLSNQTFIEGPEGLIVIDTGESVEEMRMALDAVRQHTSAPVVACIYSHFHYVNGTRALLDEAPGGELPIYGHVGIAANLRRFGGELGPRYARGLVHQFGVLLPSEGPDALENVGLGLFLRNPDHAPFTPGYLPADRTFDAGLETRIAGLEVQMTHAPSDATDSITIWFPDLGIAVNNLVWPALFNVFAIRGEEYRDPRIVIAGLDHLLTLPCDHLLGTHGPPISGRDEIRQTTEDYRDAIQLLWDQTVRGANKGLSVDELTSFVTLPERFNRTFHTRQLYGLAEHHVRQIHAGLFGWFDENEANLFPLPPAERCNRLIAGFGGPAAVRSALDAALAEADYRWAVELGAWLVRSDAGPDGRADGGLPEDRARLAAALRGIAGCTTSANARNWCLTRALDLEGTIDLARFRGHRIRQHEVLGSEPATYVEILRVLLDPERAGTQNESLAWHFDSGERAGLKLRGGVAVPFDGEGARLVIELSLDTWAELLAGKLTFDNALTQGQVRAGNDLASIRQFFSVFDHPAFAP